MSQYTSATPKPTALELDAILVSRLFMPRDRVMIGAGLPAPRVGALLAALTTAPDLAVCQALAWIDVHERHATTSPRPGMDLRDSHGAEAWLHDHEAYDDVRRLSTVFIIGGLEIDRLGATNLLGRREDGRWLRRGPGAIGTTSMAAVAKRTVLYTTRHSSEVLVADCSVRSTPGWHVPDHVAGPTACITPAGVFDFPAPAHRMRLVHLRPEWTATSVQAATGFALAGLDTATPVPPATLDELSVLRARVDQLGVLR